VFCWVWEKLYSKSTRVREMGGKLPDVEPSSGAGDNSFFKNIKIMGGHHQNTQKAVWGEWEEKQGTADNGIGHNLKEEWQYTFKRQKIIVIRFGVET